MCLFAALRIYVQNTHQRYIRTLLVKGGLTAFCPNLFNLRLNLMARALKYLCCFSCIVLFMIFITLAHFSLTSQYCPYRIFPTHQRLVFEIYIYQFDKRPILISQQFIDIFSFLFFCCPCKVEPLFDISHTPNPKALGYELRAYLK